MATSAALSTIDGSVLEGGGQILRITAGLAAILGKGISVTKIRAGRDKPGLRPQHLNGLQLIANMCDGTLTGGNVQSTEISLQPGTLHSGQFTCDTKTAG
uniref:RNA 3'-terminal phosphate cyclase n=1 Tax=Plectus sambesii TaxID=2011161 RepID=A0A914VBW1_9BILA